MIFKEEIVDDEIKEMEVSNMSQPEHIIIEQGLRLRKYDGYHDFAFPWYQDKKLVRLVDGENAKIYDYEKLNNMYSYLNKQGELYFIESMTNRGYVPIGDVTFWQYDMPIVIGNKEYKGKGIGFKVIKALIERAKTLKYDSIYVKKIYFYNIPSQKVFEKAGFKKYKKKKDGYSYILHLKGK